MQGTATASKGRTKAFRIVSGVFGALVVALSVPFGLLAPFASGDQVVHRVHNIGGATGFGVLGILLLACAWRPERVNAFQAVLLAAVACLTGGLLGQDLVAGSWFIPAVGSAILLALHPDRSAVLRFWGSPSMPMLVVVAIGLIPAIGYAMSMARLQANGLVGDPHVDMHHWSGMAVMALVLLGVAFVGALRTNGWRLTAWLAGIGVWVYGAASLGYRGYPGATTRIWSALAIAWAIAYEIVAELASERGSPS